MIGSGPVNRDCAICLPEEVSRARAGVVRVAGNRRLSGR